MKRINAIILLAVFCSTLVGFNLEGHYCNGELTDISLIGKSHCEGNCGSHDMVHEEQEVDKHEHADKKCAMKSDCKKKCESEEKGDCCKTEKLSDLSELEYSVQLNYVQPIVLMSVLLDYSVFEEETSEARCAWHHYEDPVPDEDVQVLHQSFLI